MSDKVADDLCMIIKDIFKCPEKYKDVVPAGDYVDHCGDPATKNEDGSWDVVFSDSYCKKAHIDAKNEKIMDSYALAKGWVLK